MPTIGAFWRVIHVGYCPSLRDGTDSSLGAGTPAASKRCIRVRANRIATVEASRHDRLAKSNRSEPRAVETRARGGEIQGNRILEAPIRMLTQHSESAEEPAPMYSTQTTPHRE